MCLSRSADYTISGFLYQFNKTLVEILNSRDDEEITIEGIVEDIEVSTPLLTKAIQCKYHESQEIFNFSTVYRPVLQMMSHFHDNNLKDIQYILFAHFPNEQSGSSKQLTKADIETILTTENTKLQTYTSKLKDTVDIDKFLSRFRFEFGPSINVLVTEVNNLLESSGFSSADVEPLIYPNAIQIVAELSTKHTSTERKIKKSDLLRNLTSIRTTAISRWTRELKTFEQILKLRRKQLSTNLKKNSRTRYFFINDTDLDEFGNGIITFISEYLEKYHFKVLHDQPPLFYLRCSEETFDDIRIRLHKKGIKFNDGFVTATFFDKNRLFIEPIRGKIGSTVTAEFSLRILRCENNVHLLNEVKCDDFFIFGDLELEHIDGQDINIEKIGLKKMQEIKFILGMSDVYE